MGQHDQEEGAVEREGERDDWGVTAVRHCSYAVRSWASLKVGLLKSSGTRSVPPAPGARCCARTCNAVTCTPVRAARRIPRLPAPESLPTRKSRNREPTYAGSALDTLEREYYK